MCGGRLDQSMADPLNQWEWPLSRIRLIPHVQKTWLPWKQLYPRAVLRFAVLLMLRACVRVCVSERNEGQAAPTGWGRYVGVGGGGVGVRHFCKA